MKRALPLLCAMLFALAGCERGMQDMYDQPKYVPHTPSPLFPDGNSSRPLPPDTIAHSAGTFAGTSSGRVGTQSVEREATARNAERQPFAVTSALLARGQERFNIYCAPCHSVAGDGDGLVVRHGFPAPPSYHSERLRNAPDRHFYDVISNGYGIMHSYAARVAPDDRWAIVAYIRALQLSQHAPVRMLPADARAQLSATEPQR